MPAWTRLLFGISLAFLLFPLLISCTRGETFSETRSLMGTYITLTVDAPSRAAADPAVAAAFAELERLEGLFSRWIPESELSRLNRQAYLEPVAVSPELLELSRTALEIAAMTDGAFDPTIGPLVKLWRVSRRKVPPTPGEIAAARRLVDYRAVRIEGNRIRFLKKGLSFDLGGIAKGYAADRAVAVLKDHGIRSGIVAVAGDVRVFGGALRGKPWRVGIQDPRGDGLVAWAELSEKAVSTSGDYERFFMYDGVRYHHLIDPRTGLPARGLQGLSVFHETAVMGDGLATGLFALGPKEAQKKIEEKGLAAVWIDENGLLSMSFEARSIVHKAD